MKILIFDGSYTPSIFRGWTQHHSLQSLWKVVVQPRRKTNEGEILNKHKGETKTKSGVSQHKGASPCSVLKSLLRKLFFLPILFRWYCVLWYYGVFLYYTEVQKRCFHVVGCIFWPVDFPSDIVKFFWYLEVVRKTWIFNL